MYPSHLVTRKTMNGSKSKAISATVGITDYAQNHLGDVVYVELPAIGKALDVHQTIGSIESVKAVSEVFSPVSGEVIEVNGDLNDSPESSTRTPTARAGSSSSR